MRFRASPWLHEGDGAALQVVTAIREMGPSPQRGEDGAHEEAEHCARQRAVVGQAVAECEGQREHPLAHGGLGQHAQGEVRRGVGHASASARGTEAAALAGEGHESLAGAGLAAHPHEAVSKNSAREKGPELALDETRHGSLAGSGVCEKAFEFGLHHAVEDALLGAAAGVEAFVRAVRRCRAGVK